MDAYRVKVTVRNNLLMSAIEKAGYHSQSDFARSNGLQPQAVNNLVAMRESPIAPKRGTFTPAAKVIMEVLGACPSDLWTDKQLTLKLTNNTGERVLSEDAAQILLENHVGQMTLPSPEDTLQDKQAAAIVTDALDTLTGREKNIVHMRVFDEKTLEEVAAAEGVTKERIRQIECRAFRHLRKEVLTYNRKL